jgi:pimeloyl-ACP methyl ester carboxylesterase
VLAFLFAFRHFKREKTAAGPLKYDEELAVIGGRRMVNRREALFAFGVLALSRSTRTQERAGSNDDELQKLGAAFDFFRARNAKDYAIATTSGINEAKYLKIGGIEQWVTIRGEDRANPAVLVLHGGPGDATNPWGYAGFRTWLNTYTVVQWDQRGAGKTLGRNGRASVDTVTIDRPVQDGVELADTLRTLLRKDKIILLGHSWGSVLGVLMAKRKPDLFQAFVGTGQVGKPAGAYDVAFDALVAKARALSDGRALREHSAHRPIRIRHDTPPRSAESYTLPCRSREQTTHKHNNRRRLTPGMKQKKGPLIFQGSGLCPRGGAYDWRREVAPELQTGVLLNA